MIKTKCLTCDSVLFRSPSKVEKRNFCSRKCYSETRIKELIKSGLKTRISSIRSSDFERKRISALSKKTRGSKNYAWKGESVSYRGLHQWVRREKGKPIQCSDCGIIDYAPKKIQWANIDGKYRRQLSDYIALCASCHKIFDLAMRA